MSSWEFPGTDPVEVIVDIPAGSLAVSAEPTEATIVSVEPAPPGRQQDDLLSGVRVTFSSGRLEISYPKNSGFLRGRAGLEVTVKVPPGSRCTARTASADVACLGDLASLDAKTASGDVTAASVSGPLGVSTSSGDVWLERTGAQADVRTASGDIRLRQADGDVTANSASGDVSIGTAAGSVQAQTASGDIRISSVASGQAETKTASGDTRIGVAAGAGVYLDLFTRSGSIRNDLPETGEEEADVDLRVSCRSASGDIQVARADAAPA